MTANFKFKPGEIGVFSEKYAEKAVEKFGKNCRILGLTMGNFSLVDLIHSTLKKTGPAHLTVGTWSAGIKDAHQVKWMSDTNLILSFKLLTDNSYKTRQPKYAASIEDLFGIENIRTSKIHAKFVLIANEEYNVAIRSSMNLNANKTCELFEIDESQEIYSFLKEFVDFAFQKTQSGFVESSRDVSEVVKAFFIKKGANQADLISQNWWDF